MQTPKTLGFEVWCVAWSSDGRHIAAADSWYIKGRRSSLFQMLSREPLCSASQGLRLTSDRCAGRHLVSGSYDKAVCIWSLEVEK
jgi:WD40 repeat protein